MIFSIRSRAGVCEIRAMRAMSSQVLVVSRVERGYNPAMRGATVRAARETQKGLRDE